MNKEKQKPALSGVERVVPEVRFPEFENEWNEKILENLCFKISDGIHSTPKYDNEGEYYFVNGNNLVNGIIVINESTKRVSKKEFEKHKRELGSNTILLSINGTIGNLSEYNNEKVVLGKSACYININEDKVDKKFIFYSLKTEGIRGYFNSELTGSTIKNLSLKTIKNASIKLPNQKEQQKIANCLSSLDTVITAETEKLGHLKDHKKGLLQNLFPTNSITNEQLPITNETNRNSKFVIHNSKQPQFRFPEFVNDGDWEEKEIFKACEKPFSGGTPKSNNTSYYGGDIPFIRSAEINKEKTELFLTMLGLENSSAKMIKKGDVLVALYGANSGDVGISKIDGAINQAILCLRSKTSNSFLHQYLIHKKNWIISTYIQGGQGNLSGDIIKSIELFYPSLKEQQKIANCLSSVDDLIETQEIKIKALKKHKKGLMQQLFPNSITN